MGKRKLHATTFYQCDWTGFPMRQAHCFMPTWNSAGKLLKKGAYCNWESVVAHATHLFAHDEMTSEATEKVLEFINELVGTSVTPAPSYDALYHTKGTLSVEAFHGICTRQTPCLATKITPDGQVFETMLNPKDGHFDFHDYLHKPFMFQGPPSTFHSTRKKKGNDRDLTVWYFPTKELPVNTLASQLFRMQLHGDVLLVHQSREQCFLPRARYTCFTRQHYDEIFSKKRKREREAASLAPSEYADLKSQMQSDLNKFEQKASSTAAPPKELSKVHSAGKTDGKKIAEGRRQLEALDPSALQIPAVLVGA